MDQFKHLLRRIARRVRKRPPVETSLPMPVAMLAAPYHLHSKEFRRMLINDTQTIWFVDGGIARRQSDDSWTCDLPGFMGEAYRFVMARNA